MKLCTKTLWEQSLTANSVSATGPIAQRSDIGVGDASHILYFFCAKPRYEESNDQ
jgi:hypothetical protein